MRPSILSLLIIAAPFIPGSCGVELVRSGIKDKLMRKLKRSKDLLLARQMFGVHATETPEKGLDTCVASEGCDCDSDHILIVDSNCLMFTEEIDSKDDDKCNFKLKAEEYDCGTCKGQVKKSKDQRCISVNDYPDDTYYQYDYSTKTKGDYLWNELKCEVAFSPSDCKGPVDVDIDTYEGTWTIAATNSDEVTVTLSVEYSSTDEETQEDEFTSGWDGSVSSSFSGVEASATVTASWDSSTSTTISQTSDTTSEISCESSCTSSQTVYWWMVKGSSSADSSYYVNVPSNCLFQCVDSGYGAPLCPPTFCDNSTSPVSCNCCWSLDWADDDADSGSLPDLCDYSTTAVEATAMEATAVEAPAAEVTLTPAVKATPVNLAGPLASKVIHRHSNRPHGDMPSTRIIAPNSTVVIVGAASNEVAESMALELAGAQNPTLDETSQSLQEKL